MVAVDTTHALTPNDESGIGKSRLAEAWATRLALSGVRANHVGV